MAAPPPAMLATICAVTSGGYADTPSRATPWSPANTTTRRERKGRGGQMPWQAAAQLPNSSSRPNDPGGLVRR